MQLLCLLAAAFFTAPLLAYPGLHNALREPSPIHESELAAREFTERQDIHAGVVDLSARHEDALEARELSRRQNAIRLVCPVCGQDQIVHTWIQRGLTTAWCKSCSATLKRNPDGSWFNQQQTR